jgi:putative redox protein
MEIAKLTYSGNLRTEALHITSGSNLITDAPVDNQGKGEAFSPTDILCVSLGSCMLTIMGIVAERNNINISGTTIRVSKIMKSDPRKVSKIDLLFNIPGKNLSGKEKQLLKNAALSCPVALSLHPEIEQQIDFNFQDS